MMRMTATGLLMLIALAGCSPEVGSRKWCENMDETAKGDWSVNDAKAYAQYCVFENYVDE